ncbi:PadR family transcriptional regulator [Paenibacillus cellulositrophicus]|uniref:PadR family transcriptional regulator n=1 Tax=Paenibacillus cellulositrophicus TaxID=562959 RepID=UPI00126768CE|nr:PadR family transcriptional regulator [Paenibacillus cellulositrophicus]
MSLQIFILGLLSEGEHHPYDIKKQVFKPLENTITINDGTLYYNFEVLLKKGYIRKIKVVQSENRPEKTTYGITDEGRKALEEEIYTVFQNFTSITSLYSSLLFLDKVDKHKLAYIIEESIARLEKKIRLIEERPGFSEVPDRYRDSALFISEHAYHALSNDANWLRKLMEHLRSA